MHSQTRDLLMVSHNSRFLGELVSLMYYKTGTNFLLLFNWQMSKSFITQSLIFPVFVKIHCLFIPVSLIVKLGHYNDFLVCRSWSWE